MNAIAKRAEATLQSHPHPALRLRELLEILAEEVDRTLTLTRLRVILEDHPDRFRILESWRGGWRGTLGAARNDDQASAWVLAVVDLGTPPDVPRSALKLRESVRWVGRGLDGRSRMAVSRWYAIALAERSAREAFLRRAA